MKAKAHKRWRTAMSRRYLSVVLASLAVVLPLSASAVTIHQVSSFGSNPGALQMFTYVPSSLPSSAPLVVAMHGCTQSAQAYADGAGWPKYADSEGFAVVFPQQTSSNNSNKCFNWFKSGDINRGQGEALSIKQMVDYMKSHYSIDSSRVYVTGLSAGGYMTPVMLAAYPDVFAGGGVMSGGPYKCATSMSGAYSCMSPGVDKSPSAWGDLVRNETNYSGPWPKVSIWHGDSDYTVDPSNETEDMEQWTNVNGIDQTPEVNETVKGVATHKVYEDSSGNALVETYLISGMGHGTAVDPGSNTDQCGTAGSYILAAGICSTYYTAQFWGLIGGSSGGGGGGGGGGGDTTAPTVSITAPSSGATVSGTVSFTASASDNVGVSKVEFYVDGSLKSTDTSSPYSYSWDTTAASNASHTLMAKAYDAANNTGSDSESVTVSNSGGGNLYCGTASNYNHVQAGRAYDSGGYAYADGSDQQMGLDNVYYTTTLQETSSGYYEIVSSCP